MQTKFKLSSHKTQSLQFPRSVMIWGETPLQFVFSDEKKWNLNSPVAGKIISMISKKEKLILLKSQLDSG